MPNITIISLANYRAQVEKLCGQHPIRRTQGLRAELSLYLRAGYAGELSSAVAGQTRFIWKSSISDRSHF